MQERRQVQQEFVSIGGSFFDDGADESSGGLVTVLHAPYAENLPVGEMSVREVRGRFRDRFDIHPDATAYLDGSEVGEDTVVHEGQRLMFMRRSGEKGGAKEGEKGGGKGRVKGGTERVEKANAKLQQIVTVEGDEVHATLPEGTHGVMKLRDLLASLVPSVPDTCGVILQDGVKCAMPVRGGLILVHQTPPQVYGFEWIADDSQIEYGPGTSYRKVRLALPYVIVFAVFGGVGRGIPTLSHRSECFFTNEPLEVQGLATPLCYPALLNCSKMPDVRDGPLSWICTQHLPRQQIRGRPTLEASRHDGLTALLRHLFESGFNRSSEHHEGASGFSASVAAGIDSRVASVEAWEAATSDDPLFALEVPWLPTGKTVREVAKRVGGLGTGRGRTLDTAADIVRVIFSASPTRRRRS